MTTMLESHNTIVLTSAPAGRFLEGILSGACYPGTMMEVVPATEPVGGKHTWRARSATAGHRRLVAVLLENEMIGKTCEDEIASGQKIRMYCPIPGDELLVKVAAAGTGTGDSKAIGDMLMANTDGTLITESSPESEPFMVMETMSDVVAGGSLTHVMYTGH